MGKLNIRDKRSNRLEDILVGNYIPFLGGRPKRGQIINKDDILNLRIALNTAKTLEEFLKNV